MQTRLLHDLIKGSNFSMVDIVLKVLKLLDTLDLRLSFAVDVLLTNLFANAAEVAHILFIALDHPLFFHLELILDLLKFFQFSG